MAEYIEREKAKRLLHIEYAYAAEQLIDEIPAADVAPVVHGRFVHKGPRFAGGVDWWGCGICGGLISDAELRFAYCPNCGAKMDGGNDNGKAD